MSIDSFFKQSFSIVTQAPASTFPFDLVETVGATFKGALDTVSSSDRWADAQLIAISSHWISTKSSVSVSKGDRIKYGSRYFEVTGVPDPVSLKPGHHQEIYVKEVSA